MKFKLRPTGSGVSLFLCIVYLILALAGRDGSIMLFSILFLISYVAYEVKDVKKILLERQRRLKNGKSKI